MSRLPAKGNIGLECFVEAEVDEFQTRRQLALDEYRLLTKWKPTQHNDVPGFLAILSTIAWEHFFVHDGGLLWFAVASLFTYLFAKTTRQTIWKRMRAEILSRQVELYDQLIAEREEWRSQYNEGLEAEEREKSGGRSIQSRPRFMS